MKDLIERLEKATGPDRELDGEIALLAGWQAVGVTDPITGRENVWQAPNKKVVGSPPYFTASVDAALTLVPDGWRVNWAGEGPDRTWFFELITRDEIIATARERAITPPLALCIAALKAREASR